ncbi:DUF29 domain-containing protein [Duganella sp. BJB1802]|uniref:DUF29 family protein n=1 Tax=Duganella vulcania TaxID=2692166 RepID=A0A845FWM1_9BURK|nr:MULTISPECIES: DUF29 domain-containing protein [Duganella]MYM86474.1 DUF29 family protein [Duganella vulcania]NVD71351.1 DUF29 domain-containing protein [Duganella sp. BJB1802]
MSNLYEDDIIAWSEQQAALLRRGQWSELDIDNIAEEIEDVGKSEKRELKSRLSVLTSHLLKWKYQPTRRTHSWQNTIREQRAAIRQDIKKMPSLKSLLRNANWLADVYRRALVDTHAETSLPGLPTESPWTMTEILTEEFFPD